MIKNYYVEFCDLSNVERNETFMQFCDYSMMMCRYPRWYYLPVKNNVDEIKQLSQDLNEASRGLLGLDFRLHTSLLKEDEVNGIIKHSEMNKVYDGPIHHKLSGVFKWSEPFKNFVKKDVQSVLISDILTKHGLEKYVKFELPWAGGQIEYVVFRRHLIEDTTKHDEYVSVIWNGNEKDITAMHNDIVEANHWILNEYLFSLKRVKIPVGTVLLGRLPYLDLLEEMINSNKRHRKYIQILLQDGRIKDYFKIVDL